MAELVSEIAAVRDARLRELNDLHDDFAHTQMHWRSLLVRLQRYGQSPAVRNPRTGSLTTASQWPTTTAVSLERLARRSFKDIVAQFELFLADLLRLWLTSKPTLIQEKAISVGLLLAARDLATAQSAAVSEAVELTIADKMYGRPEKWFNYIKKNLASKIPASDEMSFVELKARRDVLEHHNGVIESTYLEKSKTAAKYHRGRKVLITRDGVNDAFDLVQRLIRTTAADAIAAA